MLISIAPLKLSSHWRGCRWSLLVYGWMCAVPGDMVTAHAALAAGDESVAVPTSSRSNFSNWLNKESFQLQQAGTRYRVNEFTADRPRLMIDRQYPVTSSSPAGTCLRDVTRTRLHSDTCDASRNVRFDDVDTTAMSHDHALSPIPAPVTRVSNHTAAAVNMCN